MTSFDRWLNFRNVSPKTRDVYRNAATKFAAWLAERDVTDWAGVTREHVQDFTISILETRAPGYANHLFRALQQFAKFCATEEGIASPMAGLSPPMLPEQPPPVLREEQLRALLKVCDGKGFTQRRDTAIIYLFMDSGLRRAELGGLAVDDVDLDHREMTVLGKGRRVRTVSFGRKAAWAVDRYLSERSAHKLAELPALWLGERNRGPMAGNGIYQMIQRRGLSVGIEALHPHTLRHTWVHMAKTAHMADDEIMKIAGWRSPQMLARYAASTAAERARESNRRLSAGDRL